ncbi:hypothetical protein ACO2Q2_10960 [Dyella sp. KRB-257]|uniref:hypothetical protein n=1 Tax=Dyella sp. KRB-257 TaxID=3400915 RepID=UPI003BFD037D
MVARAPWPVVDLDHACPRRGCTVERSALRDGMARIRSALEALRHYELGHMDATMAPDRAGLIESA